MSVELKPGYKQTEVGMIPDDWEAVPFKGKIAIAHGYPFSSAYFASSGPYWLTTPGNFFEEGGFRDGGDKQKHYNGPVPNEYRLRSGDIVVAMTEQADGLLGSAAIIPNADVYLHNQRLGRISSVSSDFDVGFAYWVFNSQRFRARVRETAAGTKVKHTSPAKLLEICFPLPPIPEQRAISEALSDMDSLLAALDRLIAKKRDLKQAAMQQLLTGQTRLPGFRGDWEVKRLGEIAEMGSGGTPTSSIPAHYDGDVPWVSISDMTNSGKIITRTDRNLTHAGFANSAAQMFPTGTVLYAMYASLGECSIAGLSLCSSQAILGIRPNGRLSNEFLYYYLISLKPIVKSLGQQGAQSNLNKGMVQDFRLRLPPLPEQIAITSVLADMDTEMEALEQRRDKTRALKQAMMQELLTGRIRLVGVART